MFGKTIYERLSHTARTGFLSLRRCRLHESPSTMHQQRKRRHLSHHRAEQPKKQRGKKQSREPCTRSARPAPASWAVALMADFTLLEGERVPLLQSPTETKNRTKNQGFRNLTASADLFSGWRLHIQRNPAAEHGCPFLRDTKSLMLPSLKCLRLNWERYWVASSQLQWARQQHSATGRKS